MGRHEHVGVQWRVSGWSVWCSVGVEFSQLQWAVCGGIRVSGGVDERYSGAVRAGSVLDGGVVSVLVMCGGSVRVVVGPDVVELQRAV